MTSDLLGVLVGAVGPGLIVWVWADESIGSGFRIAGTLVGLVIATVGYLYPVIRFLQRTFAQSPDLANDSRQTIRRMLLGACLSGIALLGTWGSTQWAMTWAGQLTQGVTVPSDASFIWKHPREYTQMFTAVGAIVGTIGAAMLGDWLGRRTAYCLLCLTSIASVLWFYQFHNAFGWEFLISAFVAGVCTASFYGWLPLYLPELFATRVRATGQGFAFNFGRILAAIGTLQIGAILKHVGNYQTYAGLKGGYPIACSFVCCVYLLGMGLIWLAPETKGQPLPE